jgi:hypothetical protein
LAIGGRDDAANGPVFVERHDLRTPTIVFDEPMAVWEAYAIPGQPAGVLLDREGRSVRAGSAPSIPPPSSPRRAPSDPRGAISACLAQ